MSDEVKIVAACHECLKCKHKLLCLTSDTWMFVQFGQGGCMNFEDMENVGKRYGGPKKGKKSDSF